MIPDLVDSWLQENHFGKVLSERKVGGGCINNGMVLKTASGKSFFLKLNSSAPPDMFSREVEGLQALRDASGPIVPDPYLHRSDFLLMEDLAPAPRVRDYWQVFGWQLARLHKHTGEEFGFPNDNYIGSTPQPNPWTKDGYAFFATKRLLYLARAAHDRGDLDRGEFMDVETLAGRLPELIPTQPPSLIHGDLWSGNATTNSQGSPAIIDPAVYYGWAEADLAMTTLFGTFPEEFFRAYNEIRPLESEYRSRFPIYNLYHLLNHLLLFGRGYLGQVKTILDRYGRFR